MPPPVPRTRVAKRKFCNGCHKFHPTGDFWSAIITKYRDRCYRCRSKGNLGKVINQEPKGVGTKKKKNKKPKELFFYEVSIEDGPCRKTKDPLTDGEKFITWDRLSRSKKQNKTTKNARKKRRKRRKNKKPPWRYPQRPQSRYEELLRERYEQLWRQGLDECLPTQLLDQRTWMAFWLDHMRTDVYEKNIQKETGQNNKQKKKPKTGNATFFGW